MIDEEIVYDENGIAISGIKKGYSQSIPGSMGLVPIDLRRYKKEGKYWERKKKSIKSRIKCKSKK